MKNQNSHVPLKCDDCQQTMTVRINSFNTHHSARCGCGNLTMKMVAEYLAALLRDRHPTFRLELEYTIRCKWRKLPLRCDAVIKDASNKIVLIVEVDGAQHFRPCFHVEQYPNILQRDMDKEIWAHVRGLVLLRLFQEDVYDCKIDWKGFISRTLDRVLSGELSEAIVRQPNCAQYMMGDYAALRKGTPIE